MATVWPDSRRAVPPGMAGWVNVGLMTAAVAVLAVTMAPAPRAADTLRPAGTAPVPARVLPAAIPPAALPQVSTPVLPAATPRATPARGRLARVVTDTPPPPLASASPTTSAGPMDAMPAARPPAARQRPRGAPMRGVAND